MQYRAFKFSLPPLPKADYQTLQSLCAVAQCTQLEAICILLGRVRVAWSPQEQERFIEDLAALRLSPPAVLV